MEEEIWKDIPGYDGLYQASSLGRVRSIRYGRVLVMSPAGRTRKYDSLVLCRNGLPKTYRVHVLIAMAFHENPDGKPEVDHIDGNTKNNRADNLRWVTTKENHNNPVTIQRYRESFYRSAEKVMAASHTKEALAKGAKTRSERYSGKNSPLYGRKLPEEWRRNIGRGNTGTHTKPVIQMTMDGSFIREWLGSSYAARELGIHFSNISACCYGIQASAGGYKWKFKDE